ncbi:Os12g0594200 [Oryza sativa Japonica Group]|uniref:Os12g0594200 protein n=1 Tax=Oryza sativa subsp. japonica TaxID=39947 RepID=Q0IM69_ORYSJ|nr:Os12g0594200 [Oryza sativa Japonica Group]|eukprot:NP_001067177.2 Os12g0594200 [Oryza sativa Japonica Group]
MVLAEAARARLLAALRPWLAAEPRELRVELGLLRSRAVARGVELDAAALGDAVPGSFPARVDRVAVAEVELVASPWAAPGLDAVVRGVDVALTLREPAPKKQRPDIKEWISNEKKRVIAAMDPQGQMLHGKIEDLVSSLEDKFTSVFSTALLNCSKVRFDDVTVQVRYLDDSHLVILRTHDLQFGPELVFRCSLFRGLVGSYMPSRKKNHMFVKCDHFEFLLKGNDHTDCTVSLTGTTASVRLDNLHLTAFGIHVASAFWEIAPKFIPSLMVILEITSQKEDYEVRSGRELWKIAAQKLENSIACRRFSLRKAMSCASFWQHYVHTYILLLSLLGYPSGEVIKRNCSRVQSTRKVRETIRNHLKTVSELEEKIPVEAIARGRSAARSKLTVSQQQSEQELSKALLVSNTLKFLSPLLYVWKFLVFICWSLWRFMSSRSRGCKSSVQNFPCASDDSEIKVQFSICLGELSVTFLPLSDHHFTGTPKLNNGNKAYHIDTPSVHLVIKSSSILYTDGFTTQSFFFVIGELKADVSGIPKLLQAANGSITRRNSSFGTEEFSEDINSKTILWSDSASMHPFSGKQPDESFSYNGDSSIALLQSDMEELWSFWTVVSTFYNDSGVMHHEKPSVIFEFKSFLIDPYKSTSGFQQCRFTVGRVNLDVDYLCASSTYLLYRQFVHYKELKELTEKSAEFSNRSDSCATRTSGIADKLRSFNQRLKFLIADAIPINTLQISALIAGPSIRLIFDKNSLLQNSKNKQVPLFSQMNNTSCITLSLAYVECVIWPASLSSLTQKADLHAKESHDTFDGVEEQLESHRLALDSAGHVYSGTVVLDSCFKFADLTLLVDHIEANQQFHIFGPMSANFQLSTSRKYASSFFVTRNILSINLGGRIVGCMAFLFMDDLFPIFQVIKGMQMLALNSELGDIKYSQCFIGRLASFCNRHMDGSTMGTAVEYIIHEETVDCYTELVAEMKLDLEPTHIIVSASRDGLIFNPAMFSNSDINYISSSTVFEGVAALESLDILALGIWFSSRSSSLKLLLDGECTDLLVNLSGIQSVVFENQPQMSICDDILQYSTVLSSSPYDKSQFILSDCVFHLCAGPNKDSLMNDKMQVESISGCSTDSSGIYYFIELEFTEVYIGDYNMHNFLIEVNKPSKQKIALLIHDDLQIVKCKIKGGLIFLETLSLAKFVVCCKIYFRLLMDLSSWAASNSVKDSVTSVSAGSETTVTNRPHVSSGVHSQSEESQLGSVKCLDVDLSQFSLTLAIADESGRYQGLTLEVDAILQQLNLGMKILFEVKRISISSISIMPNTGHVKLRDVPAPRFRSSKSLALPSQSEIQEYLPFLEADNVLTYDHDAPSSSNSTVESSTGNPPLELSSHKSYILRHFATYLKLEKKELNGDSNLMRSSGDWFGNGSVSGLEVTMSLSSIEMILSLFAPFHEILRSGSTQKEIQTGDTPHQELLDNRDYTIPDGAIVAIRDLDQQMYVSIKNTGKKYQVVGTYHYSLSSECALFKVKHHKGWRSDTPCISLLSLYAKTDEGKELALSFSHGSDLVEVSSSVDKPSSLWTTSPLRFDGFEDDGDDGKYCKIISRSSNHLVNKKSNYGIAFNDGLLEFVRKPGNPFKVKVLDESLFSDVARPFVPNVNLDNNTYLDVENELPFGMGDSLETGVSSQHVIISIDKIVFTITHEVLDTDSRSFSGPFVVVKVSQNSEEGLSLSVQPLLRIYNKSDFPLELRFQRPQKSSEEAAFVTVRSGDMVDESTGVFDSMDLSGGSKRALMSLALGKPEISEHSGNFGPTTLVKWSEDITGEKAVRISGVMEKLNYNIRRAFSIDSMKSSFSSLSCDVSIDGQHVTALHFLVHTLSREVPLHPTNGSPVFDRNATVAFQLQREIFIYPTVQVYNFLQTDIHVILTDCEPENTRDDNFDIIGKQATITSGSSAYLYVNPAMFTFSVKLISYGSKSKAVNTSDWVKRMQKQISRAQFLDMELEFVIGTGRFHSSLRLLRQEKGFLEVAVFTRYTLHNTSDYPLLCTAPHKKSLPMSGTVKETINLPPQDGCILASMSMSSWFTRSSKLRIGLQHEKGSEAFIDLEALSGFTEFSLEIHDNILPRRMATFGMYLQPVLYDLPVPSQVVLIVPRYVFSNESATAVAVRQCFVEDDIDGVTIEAKQRATLHTWKPEKRREFRRSQGTVTDDMKRGTLQDGKWKQFASVDVIQETASFVLHFSKPPKAALPYRIENCLNEASIMYFQKDSVESDVLHPQESEQYTWDDLSLPRKLNIDSSFNNGLSSGKQRFDESFGLRVFKIGYEVYADGLTRVLRICEHKDNPKADNIEHPIANVQFRMTYMCIHLLEKGQQGEEKGQSPSAILAARFQHISADSVITDRYRHISLAIHSVNLDEKWEGASFGSILRRNKLQDATLSENILRIIIKLNSTNSSVKQVQYCSIILQPIDLKVDEETLMKIVPFWRTSLAPPGTPSTQFYFRHFEVHPIKIIASFRPGSPYTTYSSAQEALRALLHSVIKVPEISSSAVELNGVLLNHALVTFRELFLKCAQHYSWYVLRAIYVTKGSSLLPPSFASIFDDSASSVIDVFFDPSDGSLNLPGLTIGMFKFISKNMKSGGFSGTKRYLGDLGKTVKTASSNALFAAVTEISDSIVRGAEANGFNGMVTGFHQGILRLAMEPSVLGQAILEGGPDRKIKLDHSPGLDELYIEGYLQAMLDVMYKQEYLRIRVIDDQVILKNLPPNSALINEIVDNVKSFLVSKGLLKGDSSTIRPLRHLRNEPEWRIAPTVLTLAEHLFVSFAVRVLHREATKAIAGVVSKAKRPAGGGEDDGKGESPSSSSVGVLARRSRVWSVGRFAVSGMVAYVDGRLCRHIPNPIARRIVSGFLLSFIDSRDND